jgi:hypothetical protein
MQPTYVFLDTEWADLEGSELVSVGLVSMDGTQTFYAERDPLPQRPTDFVRSVVYPLLERGPAAVPDAVFVHQLRSFLKSMRNPIVIYDYRNDGELLRAAIAGLDLLPSELVHCTDPPTEMTLSLLQDPVVAALLEDWFAAHPQEAARRHHALTDANALRMAWCAANGMVDALWSAT